LPTLEKAKQHPHFKAPLAPNQGRGMAAVLVQFRGQTCVSLNVNNDAPAPCRSARPTSVIAPPCA